MSTPQTAEHFGLKDIVRDMKTKAVRASNDAAKKAQETSDAEYLVELRRLYGGQTLFFFDESHENRFARTGIREWNAIGRSFKECVAKTRAHMFRHKGEEQWARIERQLEGIGSDAQPMLDPEQCLVFKAGNYWYCFGCIGGDEFCDLVAKHLASSRKHDAEQKRIAANDGAD